MAAGQARIHIGAPDLLPPPRETGLPRPRPSPCLPHLQGACLSVRPPEQLVALTRVAPSRRAPAVRMLPRRCRPVVPLGPALRETEWSGAAHPARRWSARTPCPLAAPPTPSVTRWRPPLLPSGAPDALHHRSRTPCGDPSPASARAPVVASRHRLGPQTGGLVATGRRRWRLPAGVGSPHGRRGGGLAWRESSLGW